jgi:hypothetical protein
MTGRRSMVAAVVTVMAVAGSAGALLPVAALARSHGTAANRRAARTDAASLLMSLSLPPGAQRSADEPAGDGSVLSRPATSPGTPNLVDDHSWWVVPGPAETVLSNVDAHRQKGSTHVLTGSGTAGKGRLAFSFVGFAWPAITGVLSTRWLVVELVALPGGATGLRADAEVVWITPRAASERIPPGARRLQVSVDRGTAIIQSPFDVTSPTRIASVVKLLNTLPAAQPGAESCPADWGSRIRLAFYARSPTSPLAVAIINPSGCEGVQLTIRGRRQPLLSSAASPGSGISPRRSLTQLLDADLGVNLDTGVPALTDRARLRT